MGRQSSRVGQVGAVSLFVVIFAALLLTVVTVGFIQLMLKDQQQANVNDLSQSAKDAALAGVEDAKRVLLLDQSCRDGTAAASVNCAAITSALTPTPGANETECNTLAAAGIVGETNNETIVQQTTGDNAAKLNQAYTCVKIGVNTANVEGRIDANASVLVPIRGVTDFDSVEVNWFSSQDISGGAGGPGSVAFPPGVEANLLPQASWQANYPSLLRTQLIQTGTSFKLSDFDDSQAGNKSNTNTLFLYPSNAGLENKSFALDARRSPSNSPQLVKCNSDFTTALFACKATITLPTPIDSNSANRNAYLRLTALYNASSFSIKLKKAGTDVFFNRVQPEVDATGRANDVFRRVKARIKLESDFSYPEAAIDMNSDLCKNFTVTDAEDGYSTSGTCTP